MIVGAAHIGVCTKESSLWSLVGGPLGGGSWCGATCTSTPAGAAGDGNWRRRRSMYDEKGVTSPCLFLLDDSMVVVVRVLW